ncbi:MAG: protein kinase, partial [Polyangiaceae bacterium]|nr:protein kinase [Polyangiaceae bacterium]
MEIQTSNKPPAAAPPPPDAAPNAGAPADAGAQRAAGPQAPSIGGMIRRALAHWYIAVVVAILGAGLTFLFVRSRQPAYRSETVIFYREGVKTAYLGPDGPDPLRTLSARLKETLLARSNLEKVVAEFDLYPDVVRKRGVVDAVERLRGKIIFKARAPDTFSISFEGATREEAQVVTQRLGELLVEENSRVRQAQAKITSDFLDAEQKRAEGDLEKADKDLAKFLADHPEFAAEQIQPTGTQAGAALRAEQRRATEGDPTLDALERQAPRLRSRLTAPAPAAPGAAPGAGDAAAPPPALVAAKQQADQELAAARRDLAEKQARFTEAHPDVRAAMARVSTAEGAARKADQALAAAS